MTRLTTPWLLTGGAVLVVGLVVAAGLVGDEIGHSHAGEGACDAVQVADDTLPSIVTISASGAGGGGTGSGEITGSDGVVVTNDHVIAAGAGAGGQLSVLLSDGTSLPATLVGRDPQTDLAVLRVTPDRRLPTISFGDSGALRVGQPVVALGAPLGLSGSVTAGIVSALGREVTVPTGDGGTTVLTDVVQTDASINPGNSGGPLVDCSGRLVGVNTAIATVPNAAGQAGGGSVGIGFAVPAETVQAITAELLAHGQVSHPSFGMRTSTVTRQTADRFGVDPGLFVEAVVPGGSADAAGLQRGDLVTVLDGHHAPDSALLSRITVHAATGDTVDVTYLRAGETRTATVTLQPLPAAAG